MRVFDLLSIGGYRRCDPNVATPRKLFDSGMPVYYNASNKFQMV